MELGALFAEIRRAEGSKCGAGASDGEIAEAQRALAVTLPPSYVAFLRTIGWCEIDSSALFGLGQDVPPWYDLVRNTSEERTLFEPNIPHHLIPIENDGGGNHYCLDTSRPAAGDCPVVFWDHDAGRDQQPDTVADTFTDWLAERLAPQSRK